MSWVKTANMSERLGFRLLISHLAIAFMGAMFLMLSLFFHEALSQKVFKLILKSAPRVELLNNVGMQLQHSQTVLHQSVFLGHGSARDREKIWKKIWLTLHQLEVHFNQQRMRVKLEKLAKMKSLLSEIYLQQWKIWDTANTPGDSPLQFMIYEHTLPQARVMEHMIDALILLEERRMQPEVSSEQLLILIRLRSAFDGSLSALERMGYKNEAIDLVHYEKSMDEFFSIMELLRSKKSAFSAEMLGIFNWLGFEEFVWVRLVEDVKTSSSSVSKEIFLVQLNPLIKQFNVLLINILDELELRLERDTEDAIVQSAQIIWGSRLLVVMMVVLAVWIARKGTFAITRPLARLNYAAQQYSTGNLSKDIPEEGSAELMELSRSFNNMRLSLQESVGLMGAVLDTAAEAIIRIDSKGEIEAFNQAAERMFEWQSSEILGLNVSVLMNYPSESVHTSFIQQFIDTQIPHIIGTGREVEALRKSGKKFPAHLSVSHVELNGRHTFTGIIADITGRKKRQTDLSVARDRAESANRAKAAFLANMSHEIRTPMNAIIGFTDVLLRDPGHSPENATHLRTISSSAKALLRIINDILDISKLESGKFALEIVCFHLPNALADTLRTLQYQMDEKGLGLTIEYNPMLPVRFMGDPARLRQVLLNLVGNSIKFTEKGSIHIYVEAGEQDDMLHISIKDTGIGMTESQLAKVFESFTQADQTTNRRFGGTGLGTTISKQIVELMGGKIWAESTPGIGSIFHFTLHMPKATEIDSCLFEGEGAMPEDEYISPRLFRVLLAEDIEVNATLAILRLEQQGHSVHWVKNGKQVVSESQSSAYDLILMDILMPELNGLDATREIRKKEQQTGLHLPIVALTASVMREDYNKCLIAGMQGVAEKPIDFNSLFSLMEKVVPEGEGRANTRSKINISIQAGFDFSPLNGLVNYTKALDNWRVVDVYVKALVDFAQKRFNDGVEIQLLLQKRPRDIVAARAIAHSLKGVAGNLSIELVAQLATDIDAQLKNNQLKGVAASLEGLNLALEKVVQAVSSMDLKQESGQELKDFDVDKVSEIFKLLLTSLKMLNPDEVEPVLSELSNYVQESDLNEIRKQVDAFEFDNAVLKVNELLRKLKL